MIKTLRKSSLGTRLLDPFAPSKEYAEAAYRYDPDWRPWGLPLLFAVALLVVAVVGWVVDAHHFYYAYLVGWAFCVTLSLGALFFVISHHIVKAHWGIVVRRTAEVMAMSLPLLALLGIPILIGMHHLYHWTHAELFIPGEPGYDAIIAGKRAYLNTPFFIVRYVAYFAIWSLIAFLLYRLSLRQDVEPEADIPRRQRKVSAWAIPVFAVTVSFASYDFLMSLDPHWFSTIFGVYFFAGAFWSGVAMMIFLLRLMQKGGALRGVVTTEHYHDLGKWLFAFTVFWAYIGFSQYMLIWYSNIPEETIWYAHRLEHGWGWHSAALLIGHFILPFLILLSRTAKRVLPLLTVMAVYALVMHAFDLHWLTMPVLAHAEGGHAGFHWLDFACWLGFFALYVGVFLWRARRHSLVPHNDPRLALSLRFHNV